MPFEYSDHSGDVGLRVVAPTAAALFEESARGLTAIICDPRSIRGREHLRTSLRAPSLDLLLDISVIGPLVLLSIACVLGVFVMHRMTAK